MDNNYNYNQGYDNQYQQPQYQQPQYQQPQYQQPQYQQNTPANTQKKGDDLGLASLIVGAVAYVFGGGLISIVALILGIISKKRQPENNGLATAGIVLGGIGTALFVLAILFFIVYFLIVGGALVATGSM